ncbi:hypothetical protein DFH06DRAFT_1340605 [Mycena polygramma]|nr:hypothetical protein DFH06DRAFT_1340605 [Mycena polygramma]
MPKTLVLDDDLIAQLLEQLPAAGHQSISTLRASLLDANRAGAAQTEQFFGNSSPAPSSRTQRTSGPHLTGFSSPPTEATPQVTQVFITPRQTRPTRLTRLGRSHSLPPLGEDIILDDNVWRPYTSTTSCIPEEPMPPSSPLSESSTLCAANHSPLPTTTERTTDRTTELTVNLNGKRPGNPLPDAPPAKKATLRSASQKEAGAGGVGGAGGGGNGNANKCPRKGDGGRIGGDDDIGNIDGDGDCPVCGNNCAHAAANAGAGAGGAGAGARAGEGDGDSDPGETEVGSDGPVDSEGEGPAVKKKSAAAKAKKTPAKKKSFKVQPDGGPPLTKSAGELLGALACGIFLREKRTELDTFLESLGRGEEKLDYDGGHDMLGIVKRLEFFDRAGQIASFWYMLSLVQLVLHVDSLKKDLKAKGERVPGMRAIAQKYGGTSRSTFQRRIEEGTRLLSLCAASTPYILVIIAVLRKQDDIILRGKTSNDDIMAMAVALREISHEKWGTLVARLRIPLEYIRSKASFLDSIDFFYNVPQPKGSLPVIQRVPFNCLDKTDALFKDIVTNFPKLPPRSPCWFKPVAVWSIFTDPLDFTLPNVYKIVTLYIFDKTPSPVNSKTTEVFTTAQRLLAEGAEVVQSLQDLEKTILDENRYTEDVPPYIEIKGSIVDSTTVLRIEDPEHKLLNELFTLPPELRQRLEDAIALIQAAMPGEWKDDTSLRELYSYLSCHYTWYARFGEKGHDAPQDADHMNNVQRDDGARVNFGGRIPHESREMLDNLPEFAILADAYSDIFDYIRIVLQERSPDEYEGLRIFADVLPMNASSPAYPFGGFVLNLRASTWGHRDHGDKTLCVVIPFGRYVGGQLCLYELGFKFDLRMGDVLIFPSSGNEEPSFFTRTVKEMSGLVIVDCALDLR